MNATRRGFLGGMMAMFAGAGVLKAGELHPPLPDLGPGTWYTRPSCKRRDFSIKQPDMLDEGVRIFLNGEDVSDTHVVRANVRKRFIVRYTKDADGRITLGTEILRGEVAVFVPQRKCPTITLGGDSMGFAFGTAVGKHIDDMFTKPCLCPLSRWEPEQAAPGCYTIESRPLEDHIKLTRDDLDRVGRMVDERYEKQSILQREAKGLGRRLAALPERLTQSIKNAIARA